MYKLLAMIRAPLTIDTVLGLIAILYAAIFFPTFTLTLFVMIAAITGGIATLVLCLLFRHAIRLGYDTLKEKLK